MIGIVADQSCAECRVKQQRQSFVYDGTEGRIMRKDRNRILVERYCARMKELFG